MDGSTDTARNAGNGIDHERRIYRLESVWYGEGGNDGARVMIRDLVRDVAVIKAQRWILLFIGACLALMTLKMWFPALGGG